MEMTVFEKVKFNSDGTYHQVVNEMCRQDLKWGEQNHDPSKWMAILMEEVGEAAKEGLEIEAGDPLDFAGAFKVELIQAAAVIFQIIEAMDRKMPIWIKDRLYN